MNVISREHLAKLNSNNGQFMRFRIKWFGVRVTNLSRLGFLLFISGRWCFIFGTQQFNHLIDSPLLFNSVKVQNKIMMLPMSVCLNENTGLQGTSELKVKQSIPSSIIIYSSKCASAISTSESSPSDKTRRDGVRHEFKTTENILWVFNSSANTIAHMHAQNWKLNLHLDGGSNRFIVNKLRFWISISILNLQFGSLSEYK